MLDNLALGFSVAATLENLAFCFAGCLLGTFVGVLPGIGPSAALAILLPITAYFDPVSALIMLAGIYYGAQYGGSTTAILVNMPGESSSLVTCLEGYQMAKQGRAGAALAIAALGSFFAGTVCTLLIALLSQPLGKVALTIGAPEYFALMVLGIVGTIAFARGSLVKAVGAMLIGLGLSFVGTDTASASFRYTFGVLHLTEGIGFIPIILGMLGIVEIISNLEARRSGLRTVTVIGKLWPTRTELSQAVPAVLRGTAIGATLGVLPGTGATISSYASYAVEKQVARNRDRFGTGAVEGLAGPEAANNAAAQTSFIPMLSLGIPSGTIMAIMMGALLIHGIEPGPRMIVNQGNLFWGLIASMWIGNAILLVINLPMVGMWVRLLSVPYSILFPCIIILAAIGGFSVNNSTFDVALVGLFAILGYAFMKIGCEVAPLAIAFVLGPMLEETFRRAMVLSRGDPMVFIKSPIALIALTLAVLLLILVSLPRLSKAKDRALQESEP
jgi:putative tricarboxylic transport membrane protein